MRENIIQDLSTDPEYKFTSSPADGEERFLLHFTKSTIGFDEVQATDLSIYSYGSRIYISNRENAPTSSGTVEVIDLLGRVVFRAPLNNATLSTYEVNLQSGYYVVIVKTAGSVTNRKIYLQ